MGIRLSFLSLSAGGSGDSGGADAAERNRERSSLGLLPSVFRGSWWTCDAKRACQGGRGAWLVAVFLSVLVISVARALYLAGRAHIRIGSPRSSASGQQESAV